MMATTLERSACDSYWIGRFEAMASPCELLLELDERETAGRLLQQVADEAQRIEHKFSRYRDDNPVHRINTGEGRPLEVDAETARLLDFAAQCHALSDGLFDITAGGLRRVWDFRPGATPPSEAAVAACLAHVGWEKLQWQPPRLTLPAGMEIDLGGIGKEYAVDRTALLLAQATDASFVVNFGGDLHVNKPRRDGSGWQIALDDPEATGRRQKGVITLQQGALATSGDARRHLLYRGRRYSHILNPMTGWPLADAPRSVTVHAATCMEAGMLATLAMLQGAQAETFLKAQQTAYWLL